MSFERRFHEVYQRKQWAMRGVLSGDGSRWENAGNVAAWVDGLSDQGFTELLDLGCGDLEWIARSSSIPSGCWNYHGVDVVPALIAHHQRVFPWFRGTVQDLETFLSVRSEVVICRDVLFHHCNGAAETILHHINEGNWQRFLVTSHPGADNRQRRGLRAGAMLPLDVQAALPIRHDRLETLPRLAGGVHLIFHREPKV